MGPAAPEHAKFMGKNATLRQAFLSSLKMKTFLRIIFRVAVQVSEAVVKLVAAFPMPDFYGLRLNFVNFTRN